MKAIILARVSTEDQMQEGYSIPAQLQRAIAKVDQNYYITASTVLNLAKRAKELFMSSEINEKGQF